MNEELRTMYREHWEHARHCENEILWFTNIYAIILAAILVFIGEAGFDQSKDPSSLLLLALFGFILSYLGFEVETALSQGYMTYIMNIVTICYRWNLLEYFVDPKKKVFYKRAHRKLFEITMGLFAVLSVYYGLRVWVSHKLSIGHLPLYVLFIVVFIIIYRGSERWYENKWKTGERESYIEALRKHSKGENRKRLMKLFGEPKFWIKVVEEAEKMEKEQDEQVSQFSVTVLGSGTCVPSPVRYPPSYFVRASTVSENWLIDIGPGALQRLAEAGKSYKEIQRVFVSHVHADHVSSLLPLIQALNATPGFTRAEPLFIYGPSEVKDFIHCVLGSVISSNSSFDIHFHVLEDKEKVIGNNWSLLPIRVNHSTTTLGFRFTIGGRTLVYSADTGPCNGLNRLAEEADLLILECSFPKNKPSSDHLTTSQAGKIAKDAHVKKLLLSHFYPDVAEMALKKKEKEVKASGYKGEIIFAEDLITVYVL